MKTRPVSVGFVAGRQNVTGSGFLTVLSASVPLISLFLSSRIIAYVISLRFTTFAVEAYSLPWH
jgi:hypothetical protein